MITVSFSSLPRVADVSEFVFLLLQIVFTAFFTRNKNGLVLTGCVFYSDFVFFFFFITVWTCVLCVCSLKVKIFPAKIMIFGLLSMKESLMYCQEHYFLTVVHISNSCSN